MSCIISILIYSKRKRWERDNKIFICKVRLTPLGNLGVSVVIARMCNGCDARLMSYKNDGLISRHFPRNALSWWKMQINNQTKTNCWILHSTLLAKFNHQILFSDFSQCRLLLYVFEMVVPIQVIVLSFNLNWNASKVNKLLGFSLYTK